MARVQDPPHPDRHGRVDGGTVRPDRRLADPVHRHEEHLLGAGEGVLERRGVVEVAASDANAAFLQVGSAVGGPDAHPDLSGR